MLAPSEPLKLVVCLLLAHLACTHRCVKSLASVTEANVQDGRLEPGLSLRLPQPLGFFLGHLARSDHLVELLENPLFLHGTAPSGLEVNTLGGYSSSMATKSQPRPGYTADKDAVQKRLRRIEGQIRGLQRMVEEDRYCIDVLEQVSAVTRALQAVSLELLNDHLANCVLDAAKTGGAEANRKIAEASEAIGRLVRS
jgi:DNA-binding FrmR family transcriptional regulator